MRRKKKCGVRTRSKKWQGGWNVNESTKKMPPKLFGERLCTSALARRGIGSGTLQLALGSALSPVTTKKGRDEKMAIVSFGNNKPFQSGKAHVWNAELQGNKVTLWFEMANGKVIRENYRLHKEDEVENLKAVVEAILGDLPEEFDTRSLIGKPCLVRLEERPWMEGRTWTGVAEVTSCREEKKPTIRTIIPSSSESDIDDLFEDDDADDDQEASA